MQIKNKNFIKNKEVGENIKIEKEEVIAQKNLKEEYLEFYQKMKDLNIRSIGDLENLIANCRD